MDQEQSDNKNKKLIASFIVILAVVVVAVGVTFFTGKDPESTANTSTTGDSTTATETTQSTDSTATPSTTDSSSSTSSAYKDGTYSATGSYATPEGQESIGVEVTIKDGVVTDTSLDQNGSNRETKEYQAKFASGYKSQVVGKALSEINLSRVSGSSLTSNGFEKALEIIKNEAQAQS